MNNNYNNINYDIRLSSKSDWIRYFVEYQYAVDLIFKSLNGGEITVVSLPLAFLIRHTLELGYKMNLLELEKVSNTKAKIKYQGRQAHKIDDLHREFENQMKIILKKFKADKNIKIQFNNLNQKLTELKSIMHKLDEYSFAFRYPFQNDGKTFSFDKESFSEKRDLINFMEIKTLYYESLILLTYSIDIVNEIDRTNN